MPFAPDHDAVCRAWEAACLTRDTAAAAMAWSADERCTFAPFDSNEILTEPQAIAQHMSARACAWAEAESRIEPIAGWELGDVTVMAGSQTLRTFSRPGRQEIRELMLMVSATACGGELRFLSVAESVPALLPLVIAAYQEHAAAAWRRRP